MVTLTDKQASLIRSIITDSMHLWSPSSDRADYVCAHCHASPPTNNGEITHRDDCDGKVSLFLLEEKEVSSSLEDEIRSELGVDRLPASCF